MTTTDESLSSHRGRVPRPAALVAMATSLTTEDDYRPLVEGTIPAGLSGTLYRNGPGRFERAGLRKNHLLDGDGMIQGFDVDEGGVRYRNRFVRTRKFVEESAADGYRFDTWSTRRPDAEPSDLPMLENQAGVTVIQRKDSLYAIDDGPGIYELDPDTLETRGPASLDMPADQPGLFCAHTRLDPVDRTWTLTAGTGHHHHAITFDRNGRCARQVAVPLPRSAWMHDFLITETHLVYVCHPLHPDLTEFLQEGVSFWDSLRWQPENGNLIVVAHRDGTTPARVFEARTGFMWHGLNAHDRGSDIVVDYVGYSNPDNAFGPDPQLRAVMHGRAGDGDGVGTLRRLVLSRHRSAASQSVIADSGHEFPHVSGRNSGRRYRHGYLATVRPGDGVLPSGVTRIDVETGDADRFQFEPGQYCIEPIFAPDNLATPNGAAEQGWLMTIVNDSAVGAVR